MRLLEYCLSPRSNVESPVPPPRTTIRGPFARLRFFPIKSARWPISFGATTETMLRLTAIRADMMTASPTRIAVRPTGMEKRGSPISSWTRSATWVATKSKMSVTRTPTIRATPVTTANNPRGSRRSQRLTPSPGLNHLSHEVITCRVSFSTIDAPC